MPSNFTISKTLQQVAYYREICGHSGERYAGTAMEVKFLSGKRLDEVYQGDVAAIRAVLNEADDEVVNTVREIIEGKAVSALKEDCVPLTILEVTEIKGVGAKMARRLYDEAGVVGLETLKAALDAGTLAKVKGFGPKMVEKIKGHLAAEGKD